MSDGVLVPSPGAGVNEFEIEIYIWREVITDTQPGHLLNKGIIGFAREAVGNSGRIVTTSGVLKRTADPTAEAEIVSVFGSHTQVSAYPKVLEVEIPADLRVKEFVLFFLWNASSNDDDIGEFLAFRHFEGRIDGRARGK